MRIDETPLSSPAFAAARRRRLHQVLIVLLSLITLAAYANSFTGGFVLDNRPLILDDSRIRAVSEVNLGRILTENYWHRLANSGLYRPVTTLSFLFNYAVLGNGPQPAGYHAVNFALHCLNVALVYLLAYRLFGEFGLAFATAVLWAVHPLLTESVTNIVGRADLLAGAAVLAGLLVHIHGTPASRPRLAALTVLAAIGMFAKESGVVLPVVMAVYDFTFRRKIAWRLRLRYVAVLLPIACWWWARLRLIQPPLHPVVDNPLLGAGFWTAKLTAVKVIGKYLWLLVFPGRLSFDYSYNQIPMLSWRFDGWEDWQALLAAALCGLLIALAIVSYRRRPLIFFWLAFSFVTFVPTSNLLVPIGTIMAERFMYLPAFAFAACVAAGLAAAGRRLRTPALAPVAVTVICLAFACRTFARNFDWSSDETLSSSAVSAAPNSFKTHWALAIVLAHKHPAELDKAIHEIEQSIQIQSSLPDVNKAAITYGLAGELYREKGDLAEGDRNSGMVWYRKSRDVLLAGVSIDGLRNRELREHQIRNGVEPSRIPLFGVVDIYRQLGMTYMRLGEPRGALEAARHGRQLTPHDPAFYGLIVSAYSALQDYQGQAIALLEAARMFPNDSQGVQAIPDLYARMDMGGCRPASVQDGRLHLNLGCPAVQRQACRAQENLVQLLLDSKKELEARVIWKEGLDLNCPMRHFNF